MPEDNVDLVRRAYERWNERDFDAAFEKLDPEVEAHGHPELPDPGPVHGREAVRAWMEGLVEAWDEVAADVEELIPKEDRVVALVRIRGRGRGSGVDVVSGLDAHVWTLRDGRVVSIHWYQGTVEGRRLAGLD